MSLLSKIKSGIVEKINPDRVSIRQISPTEGELIIQRFIPLYEMIVKAMHNDVRCIFLDYKSDDVKNNLQTFIDKHSDLPEEINYSLNQLYKHTDSRGINAVVKPDLAFDDLNGQYYVSLHVQYSSPTPVNGKELTEIWQWMQQEVSSDIRDQVVRIIRSKLPTDNQL
jgi:hypothetical protein